MTFTGLLILASGFVLVTLAILPEATNRIRGGMFQTIKESANYKYWGFGAIAIGTFASVMDHGSVNVALPSIASHFRTDLPTVQWIVIGYALTISALLLPMGRLSDLMGRKEVYLAGSLVYVLGAALVGSSNHFTFLILARIVQGVGAAMTQGTGMAIITSIFPPRERGKAIGLIMTIVGTGAVAGPGVGGLLVTALGWRAVFFVNVPVGIMGIIASMFVLDARRSLQPGTGRQHRTFDWIGAILSTGALVTFLLAIMYGHRVGWTSPFILAAALGFPAQLAGFIWWELRASAPMLDVRFFKDKTFSFGVSAAYFMFLGSSAVLFLTPFYLQKVLGYSPLQAGLMVVPGALCMSILGPLSGRLSDYYGWRKFTVGGLSLSVTGLLILSRLTESSSIALVLPALILHSSGMGVFYSPNTSSVMSAVTQESYGVVSAFLNLIRNAANVASMAVATAIVTATMGFFGYEPSLAAVSCGDGGGVCGAFTFGMRNAYLVMMLLLLTAMAVSAFKFQGVKEMSPVISAGN